MTPHAREFYAAVFDYTLDRNEDLPDFDFTFLRQPDGHEIGGIFGSPDVSASTWVTTFEVADTNAVSEAATATGGTSSVPEDMPYGGMANITDPFGTEFSVIASPARPSRVESLTGPEPGVTRSGGMASDGEHTWPRAPTRPADPG